ncbi:TonB family protein [Shewanella sp. A25]|nr:TonB family protein [Shewanella shenzhenensis]
MTQHAMLNRSGIPVVSALITLGLFVFMAELVRSPQPLGGDVSEPPRFDIWVPERTAIPPKTQRRLDPPKPMPARERITNPGTSEETAPFTTDPVMPEMPTPTTQFTPSMMSSEAVPLVQVEPRYPIEAAQNGKEGYVIVSFDIRVDGTVSNAQVLDANPKRIFDKAAISAVMKWKYKPKFEAGKAMSQPNQRVQLDFKLDKKP